MQVWRRLLAGCDIVLAVVVLPPSLVAGFGVWVAKGPVSARALDVFGRVEVALDVAEQRLDQANASLTPAAGTSESYPGRAAEAGLRRCAEPRGSARVNCGTQSRGARHHEHYLFGTVGRRAAG